MASLVRTGGVIALRALVACPKAVDVSSCRAAHTDITFIDFFKYRRESTLDINVPMIFLICNYVSRIIDPLTSRCAKFRFKPLPVDAQVERLEEICSTEGVTAEREALEKLVTESEGDLRKSITTLQAISAASKRVSMDELAAQGSRIPEPAIDEYLRSIKSLSDSEVMNGIEVFRREGFSVDQLLHQLHERLVRDEAFSDAKRAGFDNPKGGRVDHRGDIIINVAVVLTSPPSTPSPPPPKPQGWWRLLKQGGSFLACVCSVATALGVGWIALGKGVEKKEEKKEEKKKKGQVREEVKEDVKEDVKEEVKEDVKEEVKEDVKEED